jgi:hypothetical protein
MVPFLNLKKLNDEFSNEIHDAVNKVISYGIFRGKPIKLLKIIILIISERNTLLE